VWSGAYIVRNHGYLIYDTLFALDAKLQVQPQMAGSWHQSEDGLTTITPAARPPLPRWRPRDGARLRPSPHQSAGRRQARWAWSLPIPPRPARLDERTFRIVLKGRFGSPARGDRQTERGRTVDDAETRGRWSHPDQWLHGLWTVHPPERRMEARREAGLCQEPQLQAPHRPPSGLAGGTSAQLEQIAERAQVLNTTVATQWPCTP